MTIGELKQAVTDLPNDAEVVITDGIFTWRTMDAIPYVMEHISDPQHDKPAIKIRALNGR